LWGSGLYHNAEIGNLVRIVASALSQRIKEMRVAFEQDEQLKQQLHLLTAQIKT
jgi:hypothetical protein